MSDTYDLPESDDELLAQCEVETFRAGGPGGQHQNTTESGVRLRHRPSGVMATSRARRSQYLNKMDALRRLRIKVSKLNETCPPRRPTTPARGAVARRLSEKRSRGDIKRLRRPPGEEE